MTPDRLAHAALARLDETAGAMERKWGIGRLPRLVDPALAARFEAQRDKLNDAIHSYRQDAVAAQAMATERAWKALDAAATSAGAEPLSPVVWEAHAPDGSVFVMVRTEVEAAAVTRERGHAVWTIKEAAIALTSLGAGVRSVKESFPGAEVTAVRPRGLAIGSAAPRSASTKRGHPAPHTRDLFRRPANGLLRAGDIVPSDDIPF